MARAEFDRGAAPGDLAMQHMQLVLTRSAAQQAELDTLLAAQQNAASPQYHQWLTPEEFGQRFGASDEDVQKITGWLEANGFHVDSVAHGRNVIEFSGAASDVENTFHTQIHKYMVNGRSHWANASNPEIPAALAGVVAGVASLHDFRKKPQAIRSARQFTGTISAQSSTPQFTSGSYHALGPADYATIYDINPLYAAGINGSGVTIAVVGRSDINVSDVTRFRTIFGLSDNPPQVVYNGTNPGVLGNGEVDEATLDVTWAGAVAPNATVKLVVSGSVGMTDGVDRSEVYIIDNNLADIMTESFGSCEANFTQAQETLVSSLAAQAAAQGITYVVASGDSGAAGCDDPSVVPAKGPVSVNILSSTPYNIAVGGTQFNENGNDSRYWSTLSSFNSAFTYIPEIVWNESCTAGTCTSGNSPGLWAGGGGASTLVAKPSWQTGVVGIPSDDHRYVPDVSLTAAGHDPYLICLSGSCNPTPAGQFSLDGYAGTSVATPSFAAIMALVVQKTGARQGQANVILYQLAAQEQYSQCASNARTSSNCVFNDITIGNNAVPGETSELYPATIGYDLATGLGSIDVTNLVNRWGSAYGVNPQIRFEIDSPSSSPKAVAGITKVSGWAIADTAAISSVAIAVDGVPYGNATYGDARGDVCAVFPNRPGCPNVGWSYLLDTTLLSDGSHVLDVIITATTGQKYTGAGNFTIANAAAANPMHIYVDWSSSSTAVNTSAFFSGWALDNLAAISQVSLAVDGTFVGNAPYGAIRADVCAAYPGRIGCPNVGWSSVLLDLSFLADGPHTLTVTATTSTGRSSAFSSPFKTTSFDRNGMVSIDRPTAQSGALSGPVQLYGWAFNNYDPVQRVSIVIDGAAAGNAQYGDPRQDACAVYPGKYGCPNIGWHYLLDTERLIDGVHNLQVTESAFGLRSTATTSFTIANGGNAANPTKLAIDQPVPQSTLLGTATISGWAINDNAAISSVAILVDGVQKGTATYGASRADVCAVYPNRTGCPNVGWTYALDTTQLANGPHVLQATASAVYNSQLQSAATNMMFTAANWTTNPTRIAVDRPGAQASTGGVVNVYGWAIDDYEGVSGVTISIDGVPYGAASYGASRGDVCAAFPGRAGCPNIGWNFMLDTALLSDGAHVLGVTSTTTSDRRSTVTSLFTVSNAAGNPIQIAIDAPAANATVSGAAHVYGWALDGAIGIASVQILVDGVVRGTATYGDSRADVCAVYSGASCNAGWDFSLDTTGLANGAHTIAARATGADGVKRTVGASFQVLNNPSLSN